jgi:hypothetical protein
MAATLAAERNEALVVDELELAAMSHGCGSFGVSCRFGVAWLGVSEASVPYGPEVRIPD